MEHFIFSSSLQLANTADTVHIEPLSLERIHSIKQAASTDIYLCGGGEFAGWLLEHELIEQLKLKLNPIILGDGVRLFGSSKKRAKWNLVETATFDDGLKILTYDFVHRK